MIWATFRAAAESLEAAVRKFLIETLGTLCCVLVVGGALPRRPKTPYANEERLRLYLVITVGFRVSALWCVLLKALIGGPKHLPSQGWLLWGHWNPLDPEPEIFCRAAVDRLQQRHVPPAPMPELGKV